MYISPIGHVKMERPAEIESAPSPWQGEVLPLYYERMLNVIGYSNAEWTQVHLI